MAEQDNTQHARQAIAAINDRKLDQYLQLLDDSFVMENEMAPTPIHGKQAVRQMLEGYFQGIPDLRLEIEQIITSGDQVVVRSHVTGTHKGTFLGIPATNKKIDIHSCNVTEVRNGKAIRSRLYADNAKLLQQLGVLTLPKARAAQP
jgi:steroid delta-isomerase-like uncharacterized protein